MANKWILKLPSGLAIARDGGKFACSWKIGSNYDSGLFEAKTSDQSWSKATVSKIGKKTAAKSYSVQLSAYYPYTSKYLTEVAFRLAVLYKVLPTKPALKSQYITKAFPVKVPTKPSVSASPSDENTNVCTFSWSSENTTNQIFTNVEWQTIFVTESNVTDGSKLSWKSSAAGWNTGTGSASSSQTITESTSSIATGSHTRWFRCRARGPAGASAWSYSKRVYAAPYMATVTSASMTTKPSGGLQVIANFSAQYNDAYPIDYATIEYCIDEPAANMTSPSGDSWSTGTTVKVINQTNKVSFPVENTISEDKALFIRVFTVHLDKTTNGPSKVVQYGFLKQPEDLSVVTNPTTHQATITADNESGVPGAVLAVCYRDSSNPNTHTIIGIIPNGQSSITNVQCPDWSSKSWYKFGVYALVGSYKSTPRADGVSSYAITKTIMRSSGVLWQSGTMPVAPSNVAVDPTDYPGTVKLTWQWSWTGATFAELSWADHEDAWISTEEPEKYTVTSLNASEWNVSGLETGKEWFFRIRLGNDDDIYSPWSEIVSIVPSSAPAVPVLTLSEGIIPADGSVAASWVYVTTDGTNQLTADISTVTYNGGVPTYSAPIAHAESGQSLTLYAAEEGWETGNTYYLAVRVVSESGRASEWSDPCPIIIADPLQAVIASDSLQNVTVIDDDDQQTTRTVLSLTVMPLTATITGAGTGGTTFLTIERAADYRVDRPDESNFNGFEGETIAQVRQTGESAISITRDILYGSLDDGAQYRLVATVVDGLGRSSTVTKDFEVHWAHQAIIPEATVEMIDTVAKITPIAPEGWVTGDTCDIYRLSVDKPQLIYEGAEFGTAYVDPYPAIGEFGGHRIVYKTIDGDYITDDKEMAWVDLGQDDGDILEAVYSLIDFPDGQIEVLYDASQSSQWEKDFRATRYLGGSIQGDWNKGVLLTSSLSASMVTIEDQASMELMRRLADYSGICHIRTVEGSSYPCNISVGDTRHYDQETIRAEYSLDITRIDSETLDGLTYDDWTEEEDELG